MLSAKSITDEINRLMVIAFPTAQAHINACPEGFERPAYRIRCAKFVRTDANRSTVAVSAAFEIAYCPEVDDHQIADGDALSAAQDSMIDIFSSGYIKVEDRHLQIKSTPGTLTAGEAFVDIQMDYYDDRPSAPDVTPKMGSVTTNTKLE